MTGKKDREPIRLNARIHDGVASVDLDISARLSNPLLGSHTIKLGPNTIETDISLRHFPPRVRLENSLFGEVDVHLPSSRNGADITASNTFADRVNNGRTVTLVFSGAEIATKLKPTK